MSAWPRCRTARSALDARHGLARCASVARPVRRADPGLSCTVLRFTSAPALGSPLPRVHRHWAHPCHICAGLTCAMSSKTVLQIQQLAVSRRLPTARSRSWQASPIRSASSLRVGGLHQDGHSCSALQTIVFKQTRPQTTKGKAGTAAAGPARAFFSLNQSAGRHQTVTGNCTVTTAQRQKSRTMVTGEDP